MPWLVFEMLATLLVELAAQIIMILRGASSSSKFLNSHENNAYLTPSYYLSVYAIYATKKRVLRVMLGGFAVQVTLMVVSLGISMPRIMAGFYCKAADLPAEMVLFR